VSAIRLVLALITPRLDYCNSVYAGLLQSTLEPLQRVQNAAARLVFDLRHRDHVSPYLMQLHWLTVTSRVQFKLCTLSTPFTTKNLHRISHTLYRLLRQQLSAAVFDHLPLRTMSRRGHFPSSASGPSRTQVLLPGTAFQSTFVASQRLQPLEDILFAEVFILVI